MIAYLLTTSLLSVAIAGEPDAIEGQGDDAANTPSTSSPTETSSNDDTTEAGPTPDSPQEDQSIEASIESDNLTAGDNENADEITEDVQVIEPAIETEVTTEPTSKSNDEEVEEQTEIEQMMSEIMEEMAESEENTFELDLEIDTDEESDEEFNYKGNIEYSYVLTMWESPNRNIFHVAQFSGDPQYYFRQADDWGYTVGARFQLTGSENISQRYDHTILGVTGGLQYTSFRINTSVSWMWEQYFAQSQTDKTDGFVTYQYDELVPMSGVLWENTLTYSPDDMDFGVQASVGFPFKVTGERDMGQAFKDSWQVSTRLNLSFFQLGYTRLVYPDHSIDRIQIGSGILF